MPVAGGRFTETRDSCVAPPAGKRERVRRSRLTALLIVCAVACAGAAQSTRRLRRRVSLGIIFPEGYTVSEMTARVAAVRRIAIRKRHVRPVLTARAYAKAARARSAPRAFRRSMTRRSIEGFLFPSRYDFGPSTTAQELIALQLDEFAARVGEGEPARGTRARPRSVRGAHRRVDDRARDGRAGGARARLGRDLQPPRRGHAARDRRNAPLRPRRPRNAAADEGRPREPHAVQHAPVQGAAADADREPGAARRSRLPRIRRRSITSTTCGSRTSCTTSSRPTPTSSAARRGSTATAADVRR